MLFDSLFKDIAWISVFFEYLFNHDDFMPATNHISAIKNQRHGRLFYFKTQSPTKKIAISPCHKQFFRIMQIIRVISETAKYILSHLHRHVVSTPYSIRVGKMPVLNTILLKSKYQTGIRFRTQSLQPGRKINHITLKVRNHVQMLEYIFLLIFLTEHGISHIRLFSLLYSRFPCSSSHRQRQIVVAIGLPYPPGL